LHPLSRDGFYGMTEDEIAEMKLKESPCSRP
jgi:hypothetical protein